MEPADLTVRILQEIRDGQREQTQELRGEMRELRGEMRELRGEMREMREQTNQRFETIETTLRDLAEQMVMLARGVKGALEARSATESRFEELERRVRGIDELERRVRDLEARQH